VEKTKKVKGDNGNTFTCAACGGTFLKDWSDDEALSEKEKSIGNVPLDCCSLICDVCHDQMIEAFSAMKPQGSA
jgi:hypothetical protein